MRTNLSTVVSKQLPEFIREDYLGFTAFIEAYYKWLNDQTISLEDSRDLDRTLDEYIQYFKRELAVHLPNLKETDRLAIPRIKDLYLAKGSEASYKLLFRLLYGKNVELSYPGQQMLKASDGNWNQEISVFARVDYGNPDDVVGKLVDIVTGVRVTRVLVDRKEILSGELDRVVALGGNVYEFFLDKRFFGVVHVGDKIKYKDKFQAEILPATQTPVVQQRGKNFRVGQVFEVNSGAGTGALVKVTAVDELGGIKYAELIKFGIGYAADFGVQILPVNSINNNNVTEALSFSNLYGDTLNAFDKTPGFDEQGYINAGDYWDVSDNGSGALATATISGGKVTGITITKGGSGYTMASPVIDICVPLTAQLLPVSGGVKATATAIVTNGVITGATITNQGSGYITPPSVSIRGAPGYADGAYVGTVLREYSLNYRNAPAVDQNPAQLAIKLGALVRYPGYYTTNNGFLDDSVKIQDSRYYQKYSYVIKIDERLATYKAAVKSLLHPAGMALFGEYNITNEFDLGVALECVVKALGVGLNDQVENVSDEWLTPSQASSVYGPLLTAPASSNALKNGPWKGTFLNIGKAVSDEVLAQSALLPTFTVTKPLATHLLYGGVTSDTSHVTVAGEPTFNVSKPLGTHLLYGGITSDTNVTALSDSQWKHSTIKALGSQLMFGGVTSESTNTAPTDTITKFDVTKPLATHLLYDGITSDTNVGTMTDTGGVSLNISTALSDSTVGTWSNSGKIWMNSYQGQDYYSQDYSVGLQTTFTN